MQVAKALRVNNIQQREKINEKSESYTHKNTGGGHLLLSRVNSIPVSCSWRLPAC